MSSPLRVYFYNELNRSTSGKPELCTVRFAGIFHEERSWSKSKSKFKFKFVHFKFISSCNLFTKQGGEEKCQRSKSSRFKVNIAEFDRSKYLSKHVAGLPVPFHFAA